MSKPNQGAGPKSAGRKRSAPKRSPRPGQAGTSLRRAIDKAVSRDCEKIAQALVDQTIAGNMTGARLITALTDAEKPPAPKVKKRRGPSEAMRLAMEPPWEGLTREERERDRLANGLWCCECNCPRHECRVDHARLYLEDPDDVNL
jgi:hypothetical protein